MRLTLLPVVEQVAAVATGYGNGALMAKVNIGWFIAFVYPLDHPCHQAMERDGELHVDPILPFGLHSAYLGVPIAEDGPTMFLALWGHQGGHRGCPSSAPLRKAPISPHGVERQNAL
jgi:hypothetical protein